MAGEGGEVMLFVKDNIPVINISDKVIGNNESIWVKIWFNNNVELCIGVCYRSPNIDDDENKCLMDTRFFFSGSVVIIGDFNHRDID